LQYLTDRVLEITKSRRILKKTHVYSLRFYTIQPKELKFTEFFLEKLAEKLG